MLADELCLSGALGTIDDLLRGPGTVLVNTDRGQVRRDQLEHLCLLSFRAPLKQLLDHSVANVV
jgi:hypothetical protein